MSLPDPGLAGDLLTAAMIGVVGGGHCVAMCGGIMGSIAALGRSPLRAVAAASLGRIGTYALLGAIAGSAGATLNLVDSSVAIALRVLAAALLVVIGARIAGWGNLLAPLEAAGARLLRPLTRITARSGSALVAGMGWGLLPCALVYSALAWSMTAASPADAALRMAAFGIGTLPLLATGGVLAALRPSGSGARRAIGMAVIAMGCWNVSAMLPAAGPHHGHLQAGDAAADGGRHAPAAGPAGVEWFGASDAPMHCAVRTGLTEVNAAAGAPPMIETDQNSGTGSVPVHPSPGR